MHCEHILDIKILSVFVANFIFKFGADAEVDKATQSTYKESYSSLRTLRLGEFLKFAKVCVQFIFRNVKRRTEIGQ